MVSSGQRVAKSGGEGSEKKLILKEKEDETLAR